jgi:hypothetical protein
MAIREEEQALFERWSFGIRGFVTDGAVDPEAYLGSWPKILFLLKEVNDKDGGGWCLREFLSKGALLPNGEPSRTWVRVARWIQGIRNLPAEMPWSAIRDITDEQRGCLLQSVAAVNLKKTPGGHTADANDLWKFVRQNSEPLREQFGIYSADLVICCGVGEVFRAHLRPELKWVATTRGVEYAEYEAHKFIVDYHHPEVRADKNIIYYGLIDAVREILAVPQLPYVGDPPRSTSTGE